ncbi:DNA topoisomerase I [Marinicella litoralis]|uniref:DNA topoisomerase 1 n=1 Tax=Marinicella litoralis TaxID=644220 RepID=A0A4R6Y3V5_9GAMM|nr:DNA topoisomerase I [Marinicella litoralis]TDR23788.1 DNA topoisomerase I [Marinicella litoralis]
MAENLLIVESPAKAKTIEKYLGKGHKVLASYGHVRDLLAKTGAVIPENDFELKYVDVERNKKHIDAIVKAAKKANTIYLATDLDREGEAISWHVVEILKDRKLLKGKDIKRVVFSEITKSAIQEAVANPREISIELVDAQQARRALDYLVGFNLSPLLWKKVRRGLSAGRVQSPALRLIVQREDEINAFIKEEYWTIHGQMALGKEAFESNLNIYAGNKLKKFDINNQELADKALAQLRSQAGQQLTVTELTQRERKRKPAAPFITSTLQQEAARKLGFTARKTMQIAQQLYEGMEINGQSQGLITYMRTDSLNLANDAISEIRAVIQNKYGAQQVPEKPNHYKSKSKNAQEAHEAVRAVSAQLIPAEIKKYLDHDQFRLYDLVWKRTLASQMINATIGTVSADFTFGDGHNLRANGSTIIEKGFLAVYEEGLDDGKKDNNKEKHLPNLKKGDVVDVSEINGVQHFTEPPPRYSEASLVKALEEFGIGRPSTYASIISTLLNRDYVELESKRFIPTDIGKVVARFLEAHFKDYVDYEFTARLEDALDAVSRGEKEWKPLMKEFWDPFIKLVEEKEESVSRDEAQYKRELGIDPESGKPMSVRVGKYGTFVQIGTRDDEDKPKFAGLLPGQKLDTITFEEAIALFDLPRDLGETSEGEKVSANIGRFGPYVRYGNKFVSIKEGDPYSITFEEALVIIQEKKIADANRIIQTFDDGIQVLNGRWGPYVTDGNKNGKILKDQDPKALTHEECIEILAKAPEKKKRGKKKVAKKKVAKKTSKKKVAKKKTTKKKATKKKATKKKTSKKTTKK